LEPIKFAGGIMPTTLYPRARRENIIVEELQNEILVFDSVTSQASCLNPTAALVWKLADGNTSVSEIAAKMSRELGSTVDTRVVYYALEQLDKRDLLTDRGAIPVQYRQMSRRDFLVKAGIVGAAVAIPVIISVTTPTPAMAVTPIACGQPCNLGDTCQLVTCPCSTDVSSPTGRRCGGPT
jgi:hypothetical protein